MDSWGLHPWVQLMLLSMRFKEGWGFHSNLVLDPCWDQILLAPTCIEGVWPILVELFCVFSLFFVHVEWFLQKDFICHQLWDLFLSLSDTQAMYVIVCTWIWDKIQNCGTCWNGSCDKYEIGTLVEMGHATNTKLGHLLKWVTPIYCHLTCKFILCQFALGLSCRNSGFVFMKDCAWVWT
jgi:hypothetical protein